jgi:neutral ceramidase
MKRIMITICAAVLVFGAAAGSTQSNRAALKVGAAKIDITPSPEQLPKGMEGVLDHLFIRAIVIENGTSRAALVSIDTGIVGPDTWSHVSARAARELGIPVNQLFLTATHTHSAPWVQGAAYEDQIIDAIRQAKNRIQPALLSYGTGISYINVNRNIIDPNTHRWWEGPNYEGPSDKTVAVVQFSSPSGEPIAVYYNYAVHAVLTGQLDLVSGDIPGATSRYIEESLGNGAVAAWSLGAAGDQNPIYFQQTYDLRKIRIDDHATRGIDISNAMPPGGQGLNKQDPRVIKLMNQQKQMALSMGQMLGEEVLHVIRSNLERPTASAVISGSQKTFSCPGRRQTNSGRAGYAGTYVDADPVTIKLSLLKIGDVVIGGVNSEVFNAIAQRFKRESPYKRTMMVTLANGMAPSGYIPNDAAYGYETFEVLSSRLKPGCAETSIVNGLLDLMTGAPTVH